MNKEGKVKPLPMLIGIGAVLVVLILGTFLAGMWGYGPSTSLSQGQTSGLSDNQLKELTAGALASCPSDGDTSFILDVANIRNETGAETFDVTAYVKDLETGAITTITDTTAPSAATISCGHEHEVEIVRVDADQGDNSRVLKIISGGSNAQLTAEGTVKFVPTSSTYSMRLGVAQHGVLEFRMYDFDMAAFQINSDNDGTDYETDGASFESTTNGTAKAVGAGGQIHSELEVRSTISDTDFNDYYTLILVEAPTATWNEPVLKVAGQKLANVKGSLNAEEAIQFAGYEYVYRLDQPILDGGDGVKIDFYMSAKAGQDPSTDPEIDFASAGRYLSLDGVTTKVGAADDTSSNAVVFAVQDVTLNIS